MSFVDHYNQLVKIERDLKHSDSIDADKLEQTLLEARSHYENCSQRVNAVKRLLNHQSDDEF
jgi:hypothetical protein